MVGFIGIVSRLTPAGADSAYRRSLDRGPLDFVGILVQGGGPATRRCGSAFPLGGSPLNKMIPTTIEEEINAYLGCSPKSYLITSFDGIQDSGCVYWDLPPLKNEDKPIVTRYQELATQIAQLINEDENDPEVDVLVKKANELLNGVPVTRRFGMPLVSESDLLRLDKTKGIRKEWWELHSRYSTRGVCVFQGYRSAQALASRIADILIVMPGEDQYDFLRSNQTRGNSHPVDTEQIILALRKLDTEFGISIIYATMDSVEFLFNRSVEDESRAKVRRRLGRLCPSAEDLTGSIRLGRVTLWWD